MATRAASETSLKVFIQLNHTELLSALLSSCGVPSDKHSSLYPVLVDVTLGELGEMGITLFGIYRDSKCNLVEIIRKDLFRGDSILFCSTLFYSK